MFIVGIFGAGGHGRSIMPVVRRCLARAPFGDQTKLVFVVPDGQGCPAINGYPVMTESEFFLEDSTEKYFNVAIANSKLREEICKRAIGHFCKPFSIVAENSIVFDNNEIGEGVMLSPFVTVTSNVRIGRFFHGNLYSYVEHDCLIGDFVTFAPSVHCNGNVIVHDHAYIGTGAILKHGSPTKPLVIGKGAIVGMGAVVTKDVESGAVVVGNPARPLQR